MSPERWALVQPFVSEQILRLDVDLAAAKAWIRYLAYACAWCIGQHIPLDVEHVLDPVSVERYCAEGFVGTPSATSTIRWQLRRLGRVLTATAPWEPLRPTYARCKLRPPYSEKELRLVERDVACQATELRRHAAQVVVAAGLGAGLDGRWVPKLAGTDVYRDRDGAVVVSVPSPMPRQVVVRDRYAGELLKLAQMAGEGPLLQRRLVAKDFSIIFTEITIDSGRILLVPGRLRSSWLLAHLEARTSLPVLIEAAGLKGFGNLQDLVPYVSAPVRAELRRQLRVA
jgi:hypothetical protein